LGTGAAPRNKEQIISAAGTTTGWDVKREITLVKAI
jgi:hypothetical protein